MRIHTRKAKLVLAICACMIVLGIGWLFVSQPEAEKDSLQVLELDARESQRIPDEYILYSDEDTVHDAVVFLFASPDRKDFIYSFYIGENFLSGGAPILDEINTVNIEKINGSGANFLLLFFRGDSSADRVVLLDAEGNELRSITLPSQPYVQILDSAELEGMQMYELRRGEDVLEAKECEWCAEDFG